MSSQSYKFHIFTIFLFYESKSLIKFSYVACFVEPGIQNSPAHLAFPLVVYIRIQASSHLCRRRSFQVV